VQKGEKEIGKVEKPEKSGKPPWKDKASKPEKTHTNKIEPADDVQKEEAEPKPAAVHEPVDPFERGRWNLPDYIVEENGTLTCSLCSVPSAQLMAMIMHLGGDRHAKKCRSMGYNEIIYVPERDRLEFLTNGRPVVRTDFEAPKDKSSSSKATKAASSGSTAARSGSSSSPQVDQQPLPSGWEAHVDPESGSQYYWNPSTKKSQWDRPGTNPSNGKDSALPPGWQAVWNDAQGRYYYADIEAQRVQWEPPPPHSQGAWARQIDPAGKAFWSCGSSSRKEEATWFYEDSPDWRRLVDSDSRVYWSSPSTGIRFFETSN